MKYMLIGKKIKYDLDDEANPTHVFLKYFFFKPDIIVLSITRNK
jgi:hypothetical protein